MDDGYRWTSLRKADLLERVDSGDLTASEAMINYGISSEELEEWHRLYKKHGREALRVTRLQIYRRAK